MSNPLKPCGESFMCASMFTTTGTVLSGVAGIIFDWNYYSTCVFVVFTGATVVTCALGIRMTLQSGSKRREDTQAQVLVRARLNQINEEAGVELKELEP